MIPYLQQSPYLRPGFTAPYVPNPQEATLIAARLEAIQALPQPGHRTFLFRPREGLVRVILPNAAKTQDPAKEPPGVMGVEPSLEDPLDEEVMAMLMDEEATPSFHPSKQPRS